MHRLTSLSLVVCFAAFALAAQHPSAPPSRPTAPHDSVRGAVSAVNVQARTLDVTTGVGFAIRVVRLQVPADVPITDRGRQRASMRFVELKPGDLVRAAFGNRPTGLVAYAIERVGRMATGVDSTP